MGFSWTYGANNQYSKFYTSFDITLGKKTASITNSATGKTYTCYYVDTTPYISTGSVLSGVGTPKTVQVEFTCPTLTQNTQYMGDTITSGHKARISFIKGKVNYGYTKTIKATAKNYAYYSSVSGSGTAYSYN